MNICFVLVSENFCNFAFRNVPHDASENSCPYSRHLLLNRVGRPKRLDPPTHPKIGETASCAAASATEAGGKWSGGSRPHHVSWRQSHIAKDCCRVGQHNLYSLGGAQRLRSKQRSTLTASLRFAYLQAPSSKLTVIWQFGSLHIGSKFAKTYIIQFNTIAVNF